MQIGCFNPVSGLLEDLALESVEFQECWGVVDCQVHVVQCLGYVPLIHIVMRHEIVQPEKHGWVLFVFVFWL